VPPLAARDGNPEALAKVRIGRDKPVRLIVDTGSTGLRVLASALPTGRGTGVRRGSRIQRSRADSGQTFAGPVDHATVKIGGVGTTSPVPLQVVTKHRCPDGRCPVIPHAHAQGILGIGLPIPPHGLPTNPLLSLPAPYDQTWSVALHQAAGTATGSLVLGATMPSAAVTIGLSRDTAHGWSGWNDRPRLCMALVGQTLCGSTVLDSGSSIFTLNVPHHGFPKQASPVRSNVHIGLVASPPETTSRRQVWSFTTGDTLGVNRLYVSRLHAESDWGVPLFYARTITYDATRGQITIASN
jgi:hypothetical protein